MKKEKGGGEKRRRGVSVGLYREREWPPKSTINGGGNKKGKMNHDCPGGEKKEGGPLWTIREENLQ